VAAFIWGVWKSAGRESVNPGRRTLPVAIGTILWLTAILLVVGCAWLEGDQRRLLFVAVAINAVSFGVGLSSVGRWLSLLPLPAIAGLRVDRECSRTGPIGERRAGRGLVVTGVLRLAGRAETSTDFSCSLCAHHSGLHRRRVDRAYRAHSRSASTRRIFRLTRCRQISGKRLLFQRTTKKRCCLGCSIPLTSRERAIRSGRTQSK
jgi:hypothetical protein